MKSHIYLYKSHVSYICACAWDAHTGLIYAGYNAECAHAHSPIYLSIDLSIYIMHNADLHM